MERISIKAEKREDAGKGAARGLRRKGVIPAVLYREGSSLPIQLDKAELGRFLHRSGGEQVIVNLAVNARDAMPKGGRLAFVTYSGAQAIMSIDTAMDEGLGVATFSPSTRERLATVISTPAKAANPVDIFPDMMAHGYEKLCTHVLKALLDDEGVHGSGGVSIYSLRRQHRP